MPNVTLKGKPVSVVGEEVRAGKKAPSFKLQLADMSDYTLESGAGKTRILCAVPSLDTPVCDLEMKRFNDEAAKLKNTEVVCVSMDLPMAGKRWCGAASAGNIKTASDHRDASFGKAFGCLIAGGALDRMLCRAVFVVGPDHMVKHVEYVGEIAEQPNFAAVLGAAAK
ncbi:MAG: thiol peroxidase [Planctomycetota bacterium]